MCRSENSLFYSLVRILITSKVILPKSVYFCCGGSHIESLIKTSLPSLYALKAHGVRKEAIHKVTEAIIMSRILYAAPAWWGLTQASAASDILKIDKLQRKLQKIEYASHDQPTVESKVHKAEEKLLKKVTVEEDHVLRQYLPQNSAIKYNLRPRPHNFLLPPKDDSLFISRMLFRKSLGKE